jgi:hypothetical protein
MACKKSRREALREFNRQQAANHGDDYGTVESAQYCADRAALQRQADAAFKKYQALKAVTELETLRANGGRLQ